MVGRKQNLNCATAVKRFLRGDLHDATVDMTTDGVEETTVVTAMALEEGLELAGKTMVCFWVGMVRMEVEPSLAAALLCA